MAKLVPGFVRAAIAIAILAGAALGAHAEDRFSFVALGDMPYGPPNEVYPPYRALINEVNVRDPAFTIHVGDTKSGSSPCSDTMLLQQRAFLNSFEGALVYTPGDNEWTDCHRKKAAWPDCPLNAAGDCDPLDRLAFIRHEYFAHGAESLGAVPMVVQRQSDMQPAFSTFVENARFGKGRVAFITAHVVGSNNNHDNNAAEFAERDRANVAWLVDSFQRIVANNAAAIVVAIHANMFQDGFDDEAFSEDSGFKNFGDALRRQAAAFGRPVLLIYGDSHTYRVMQPFEETAPKLVALEVFGAQDMHAVEITVDPNSEPIFTFEPVINPAL
jgi:hypothetical protein